MTELTHRRPQSVADAQTVDYTKALNYLGLSPGQPAAQALILVCQRYQLDPLLGHISLYDGKPYVHFSGYLHIANAHPEFEGIECLREWETETHFLATVRVHRNDRSYPAERTGRSLKVKPKKGGGSYVDEHADAKAFAQAARRALRMAFNVDHPDPVDDHGGETPAPEPVVEVARMVGGPHMSERLQEYQPSGVGEREGFCIYPTSNGWCSQPYDWHVDGNNPLYRGHRFKAPNLSGAGEREPTISPDSRDLRHDPAPDSTSDPWGLSPRDPGSDPTSPPLSADTGKGSGGGDTNPPEPSPEDGDALPDDEGGGSDVSRGTAVTRAAVEHATVDPTPPADPSPVQAWASAHGHDIRLLRVYLKRNHPDEFGDMKDRLDLDELRGDRARLAIQYLEAAFLPGEENS